MLGLAFIIFALADFISVLIKDIDFPLLRHPLTIFINRPESEQTMEVKVALSFLVNRIMDCSICTHTFGNKVIHNILTNYFLSNFISPLIWQTHFHHTAELSLWTFLYHLN